VFHNTSIAWSRGPCVHVKKGWLSRFGNLASAVEGNMQLQSGQTVGIVGGGPAGSFAALHLLAEAAAAQLQLKVLIFEPRDFAGKGARSCKGCAGILSAGAVRNLASLGLELPPDVIQSELRAYVIHLGGQVTTLEQSDPTRRILSVYRGTGPRVPHAPTRTSFDGFLLASAQARGARWIQQRVQSVEYLDRPMVVTEEETFPVDLLVLASGVNCHHPLEPAFDYQPPKTLTMAQDELLRPDNWPTDKVAGFFGEPKELLFGAVVPKGPYLNVSLLWNGPTASAIENFYRAQAGPLQHFFPPRSEGDWQPEGLCGCQPQIAISEAHHYFGDRWVAVGDSAVARLYKDGINSAFLTAQRAMRTAIHSGITAEDFRTGYAPFCHDIASDNRFGRWLFAACAWALKFPGIAAAFIRAVNGERSLTRDEQCHIRLGWGILTGDESYRTLCRLLLAPRSLLTFGRAYFSAIFASKGSPS
jgi:flavin-dependent dehydrogenase